MAGANLSNINEWKALHAKLSGTERAKSHTAMTAFSSAITQAGMRRSAEAKRMFNIGLRAWGYFAGTTNQPMHMALTSMLAQAKNAMEKFGGTAERHNLPSVDTKGKALPKPGSEEKPPTNKTSNIKKIAIGLGITVVVLGIGSFFIAK